MCANAGLQTSGFSDARSYVGTPLSKADAASLGFLSFDGSAIVADAGRNFLLVTPESSGVLHDGSLALEFDSIAGGSLERVAGVPVVELHVPAQSGLPVDRRGGQADYHALNLAGGLLQPALHVEDSPEFFQIESTHLTIVAPLAVPVLSGFGSALAIGALTLAGVIRCSADS